MTDSASTCHFQHGKTLLGTIYFIAWLLLLKPWMRVILVSHSERYSGAIGSRIKQIIERFGKPFGVRLRQDSKAKNEWNIDSGPGGWDGGLVAKGYTGDINGRACDLLVMDDVLKNAQQATSEVVLEAQWNFYEVVAYSRLGPNAPIVMVTTRWVKGDLPGRIYAEAKETGEKWRVLKFKAIAEEGDPLGRKPGEALWPERVPLARLELIKKKRGRWFKACWQQEPEEEHGMHFRPRPSKDHPGWPRYRDIGGAWILSGRQDNIVYHKDVYRLLGFDLSLAKKKTSDKCAFVLAAQTKQRYLLILDVVDDRIRVEEQGRFMSGYCQRWGPHIVAADEDMLAEMFQVECRRWPGVPEIRKLPISGNNKLYRASSAIILGENGMVFLPQEAPWLDPFCDQLESFVGDGTDEYDDMVDAMGIVGRLADMLKSGARQSEAMPIVVGGRGIF